MPMYVRRTQSVQLNELTDRIAGKLAEHAGSRQIDLRNVRLWMTHSENPPAGGGFGKLLRRRANSSDPDAEHWTVVVLHPTQILVVIDGERAVPPPCLYRWRRPQWLPASVSARR
jgi:hypothetical protein